MSKKPIWDYHSQEWWTPPDDPEPSVSSKIGLLIMAILILVAVILSH